jgi:hypothetical protein
MYQVPHRSLIIRRPHFRSLHQNLMWSTKCSPQSISDTDIECLTVGDSVLCDVPQTMKTSEPSLECMAVGDSVMCDVPPEASNSQTSDTTATSLLDMALLVFPFFAWGTSMPALKLVMPHIPSPLLLGALRLLPAGILLVIWAGATGRKHPTSIQAWGWILLFGLVDGAAFQVRTRPHSHNLSLHH